jgi:hypothetical protein
MIISIDTEKACDQTLNEYAFMTKTLSKLVIEGNYLNIIKVTHESPEQTWGPVVKD